MSLETEVLPPKSHSKPPRLRRFLPLQFTAWLVLLFCFALFCLITYLVASSLIDYFSNSVKLQRASVTALGGPDATGPEVSVLHTGQERFLLVAQNQSEPINQGDVVRTGPGSRAVLTLFDGTSLELASNSQVRLNEHQIRITNFVQQEKRIAFQVERGVVTVKVEPLSVRDYSKATIKGTTPDEAEVLFNDQLKGNYPGGAYTIDLIGNGTNRTWVTSLPSNQHAIDVRSAGQTSSLEPRQYLIIERGMPPLLPERRERELIANGAFIDGFDHWKEQHDQGGDAGDVRGRALPDSEMIDDATITRAHILRYESKDNFEETSLRQDLNGVDVREYTALIFRFKGRLQRQSLPGGGTAAIEYPLFVKINYTDRDGQTREFFRGVYFKAADANTRTLDRISNELSASQQWKENKWQEFEFDLSQLRQKPVQINSIVIGAAGHDYETYFTEVSLIGRLRNF